MLSDYQYIRMCGSFAKKKKNGWFEMYIARLWYSTQLLFDFAWRLAEGDVLQKGFSFSIVHN